MFGLGSVILVVVTREPLLVVLVLVLYGLSLVPAPVVSPPE